MAIEHLHRKAGRLQPVLLCSGRAHLQAPSRDRRVGHFCDEASPRVDAPARWRVNAVVSPITLTDLRQPSENFRQIPIPRGTLSVSGIHPSGGRLD